MGNHFTEDTLVQQTTAEYLHDQLGWESIYAYNNENFGSDSLLARDTVREVVLTRSLRTELEELNPGLPLAAYEEGLRQITAVVSAQSLAILDLLKKPELTPAEIKRIKSVAVELLDTLKTEKLNVDQWRDKEATRDAVRLAIKDFLWRDETGLPVDHFEEDEVVSRAEEVYRHIYQVYSKIPSPFYESTAVV